MISNLEYSGIQKFKSQEFRALAITIQVCQARQARKKKKQARHGLGLMLGLSHPACLLVANVLKSRLDVADPEYDEIYRRSSRELHENHQIEDHLVQGFPNFFPPRTF